MQRQIVLHSTLTPSEVKNILRRIIDPEEWTLFSLSRYKGESELLGEVNDDSFRLQKRRYYRNDFAPQFYGRIRSANTGGTIIEGYFDMPAWSRNFMYVWLAVTAVLGAHAFFRSASDLFLGTTYMSGDPWVGLIVPPAMVAFGILLPKFGRFVGSHEETYILLRLQQDLAATVTSS